MTLQITKQKNGPTPDSLAADYGRLVSSVCRRMIRDEDRARDAAQQAWVEIVKAFPAFRGDRHLAYGFRQGVVDTLCPGRLYALRGDNRDLPGDDLLEEMRTEVRGWNGRISKNNDRLLKDVPSVPVL